MNCSSGPSPAPESTKERRIGHGGGAYFKTSMSIMASPLGTDAHCAASVAMFWTWSSWPREFQRDVIASMTKETALTASGGRSQAVGGPGGDKLGWGEASRTRRCPMTCARAACYRARSMAYGRRGASGVPARHNGDLGRHHAALTYKRQTVPWGFNGLRRHEVRFVQIT